MNMATIGNYTFPTHKTGDTIKVITFTIKINLVPLDLTDSIIRMDVRTPSGTLIRRFSTIDDDGLSFILPQTDGKFQFNEQIISFEPGSYIYDMEFTFPNGDIFTYVEGTWTIINDITKGYSP